MKAFIAKLAALRCNSSGRSLAYSTKTFRNRSLLAPAGMQIAPSSNPVCSSCVSFAPAKYPLQIARLISDSVSHSDNNFFCGKIFRVSRADNRHCHNSNESQYSEFHFLISRAVIAVLVKFHSNKIIPFTYCNLCSSLMPLYCFLLLVYKIVKASLILLNVIVETI